MKLVGALGLAGIFLAGQEVAVKADELSSLKRQIADITSRVAEMEAQPSLPVDGRLIMMSQGPLLPTPGVQMSAREQQQSLSDQTNYLALLPTADAPAGPAISWSGYVYAGVVYTGIRRDGTLKTYDDTTGAWILEGTEKLDQAQDDGDVGGHSELRVQASNDTSVGKVGAELKLWGDYNGNGQNDLYAKVAWGYWSMTPELTLAGGYNASLGYVNFGYDATCTCYFTDNADVSFDPGDTSQLQLSYTHGGYSAAVAVEDSSLDNNEINPGLLGVAGQMSYTGDVFAGQIAGVWRDSNEQTTGAGSIWQVGVGGSVTLGKIASLSVAAATGQGPYLVVSKEGTVVNGLAYDNTWWGVNGLASVNFSETAHIEVAAGYKNRDGDQKQYKGYIVNSASYDVYAVMGGLYYTPVDQLTLGIEAEWSSESINVDAAAGNKRYIADDHTDTLTADVAANWAF